MILDQTTRIATRLLGFTEVNRKHGNSLREHLARQVEVFCLPGTSSLVQYAPRVLVREWSIDGRTGDILSWLWVMGWCQRLGRVGEWPRSSGQEREDGREVNGSALVIKKARGHN